MRNTKNLCLSQSSIHPYCLNRRAKRNECVMTREGYTLIEIVISLSLSASVLVLATKLIHQSMFLSSSTLQYENQTQTFRQFSETFRRNVQHSTKITEAEQGKWTFLLDNDQVVDYQTSDRSIHYALREGGQLVQQDRLRFRHPFRAVIVRLDQPPRLQLSLHRTDFFADELAAVEGRVTAVIGTRVATGDTSQLDPSLPESPLSEASQ